MGGCCCGYRGDAATMHSLGDVERRRVVAHPSRGVLPAALRRCTDPYLARPVEATRVGVAVVRLRLGQRPAVSAAGIPPEFLMAHTPPCSRSGPGVGEAEAGQ
jgi:hypothetical protein